MEENRYFSFGVVSVLVHGVVIGGLLLWAFIDGCNFKKNPPEIIPFTVAVDPVGEPEVPEEKKPEPQVKEEPKKDDVPAVIPDKPKPPEKKPPEKKPPEKKPPEKKPPEKNPKTTMTKGQRIDRPKTIQPKFNPTERQKLSDKEIQDALRRGAKIGPTTSIPKDDQSICFSILKRELVRAWNKPSKENGGYQPAEVKFSLAAGGRISNPVLVTSSGSRVFDESVLAAVRNVIRVDGLTQQFIKNYPEIVIDFSFED